MSRNAILLLLAGAAAVLALFLWWAAGEPPDGGTVAGAGTGAAAAEPARAPTAENRAPVPGTDAEKPAENGAPEPPPPGGGILVRLRGRVIDATTGHPVAGAAVALAEDAAGTGAAGTGAAGAPVTTGSDGGYAVEFRLAGQRRVVTARHPDYLAARRTVWNRRVPRDGQVRGFDLELRSLGEAAHLSGRVADLDHAPVAGALVSVRRSPEAPMGSQVEAPPQVTRTGTDGSFAFAGLAPGRVDLTVEAAGFGDHDRFGVELPRSGRVELEPMLLERYAFAVLEGAVRGPRGDPVPGAEVWVGQPYGKRAQATTGADGTFRLARLHPGRFVTGLKLAGRFTAGTRLEFTAGSTTRHDFAIPGGSGSIAGRVFVGGEPAAGLEVTAWPSGGESESGSRSWKAHTDAAGGFRLDDLPDGKFDLNFVREHPYVSHDAEGIPVGQTGREFRFPKIAEIRVRGVVRDVDGALLAGVSIAPPVPGTPGERAVSGGDGSYALTMRITYDADYLLIAECDGFLAETVRVMQTAANDQGSVTRDVTMHRVAATGTIDGTVVTTGGRPVRGVSVLCASRASKARWRTFTDSRGRFLLSAVVPGDLRLILHRGPGRPMIQHPIGPLEPGGRLTPRIEIPEDERFQREVQVIDAAGHPVRGVQVSAWTAKGMHLTDDRTDQAGLARLRDLPGGTTRLSVRAPGFARHEMRHEVSGESTARLEFRLHRGSGVVRGQVIGAGGRPREQVAITVEGKVPGNRVSAFTNTDADGRFAVEDLPPGAYTITVWTTEVEKRVDTRADGREVRIVIE